MINFPKAKINLGLRIIEKRPDGYHNLETLFVPIPLTDALEIVEADKTALDCGGIDISCIMEENIVYRAYQLMRKKYSLPPVKMILRKHIPHGAGLGGGSSDAASCLHILNEMFSLGLDTVELMSIGSQLGADVPCFMIDAPSYGTGIGDKLVPMSLPQLKGKKLLLLLPNIHVSTATAYQNVQPNASRQSLKYDLEKPLSEYRAIVENDFERSVFKVYPVLGRMKQELYDAGAIYASMSGSGSAIYGIFDGDLPTFSSDLKQYHLNL